MKNGCAAQSKNIQPPTPLSMGRWLDFMSTLVVTRTPTGFQAGTVSPHVVLRKITQKPGCNGELGDAWLAAVNDGGQFLADAFDTRPVVAIQAWTGCASLPCSSARRRQSVCALCPCDPAAGEGKACHSVGGLDPARIFNDAADAEGFRHGEEPAHGAGKVGARAFGDLQDFRQELHGLQG